MKKRKNPALAFLWLLMIPVQLVIDTALVSLGAYADISMRDPSAYGHPMPFFSVLALLAAGIITVIVFIAAVVLVIVRYAVLKKR